MKTIAVVEWLEKQLDNTLSDTDYLTWKLVCEDLKVAKEMEKHQKSINQLFIGKVVGVLGVDKTIELLKEATNAIKK
jgi:hypothetical protein